MALSFGCGIFSAGRLDVCLDASAPGSGGDATGGGTEVYVHVVRVGSGPAACAVPERQAALRLQYPRQSVGSVPGDATGTASAGVDSCRTRTGGRGRAVGPGGVGREPPVGQRQYRSAGR